MIARGDPSVLLTIGRLFAAKRTVLWMPTTRKSVNPRSIANSTTDLRFVAEGLKAGRSMTGRSMRSEDARPTMAPASQGWCPAHRHGGEGGVRERRPMTENITSQG